jgi:hypothetical protein
MERTDVEHTKSGSLLLGQLPHRRLQHGTPTVLSMKVSAYRIRSWMEIEKWMEHHPHEVRQRDGNHRSVLELALYRAIDFPPLKTVKSILRRNPLAVWSGVTSTNSLHSSSCHPLANLASVLPRSRFPMSSQAQVLSTPLQLAAHRRESSLVLQELMKSRPSVPSDAEAVVSFWCSSRASLIRTVGPNRNAQFRDWLLGRGGVYVMEISSTGCDLDRTPTTWPMPTLESIFAGCGGSMREAATVLLQLAQLIQYVGDRSTYRSRSFTGLHSVVAMPDASYSQQAETYYSCDPALLAWLLELFPEQLTQSNHYAPNDGRWPLHCLVAHPSTQLAANAQSSDDQSTTALDDNRNGTEERCNGYLDRPYHHPDNICRWHRRIRNLSLLVQACPQACRVPDRNGDLPLHLAIRAQIWKDACSCDCAARTQAPSAADPFTEYCPTMALDMLVREFPEALSLPDGHDALVPFLEAAATTNGVEASSAQENALAVSVIFSLLRNNPDALAVVRIQKHQCCSQEYRCASLRSDDIDASEDDREPTHELLVVLERLDNFPQHNEDLWQGLNETLCRPMSPTNVRTTPFCFPHALAGLPKCPPELLDLFVALEPQSLRRGDCQGRSALHHFAMMGANPDLDISAAWDRRITGCYDDTLNAEDAGPDNQRLQYLLEADPSAAHTEDNLGWLPLHLAARSGSPVPALARIVQAWPDALRRQGANKMYPALLAACGQGSIDEVYFLLQAAPDILWGCDKSKQFMNMS